MPDETTTPDPESIAKRVVQMLRGARQAPDGGEDGLEDIGGDRRGYVSVDRLRREIDKRKALERKLADIEDSVTELGTSYDARLEALKKGTADEVTRIGQVHAEDLRLVDMGVTDPLGRKTVRDAWAMQPKTGRAASPADWFQGLQQAHQAHVDDPKAHPEAPAIPRPLAPYIAPAAKQAAPAPAPQRRSAPPPGPRPAASGFEGLDGSQGIDVLFGQIHAMESQG